MSNATRLSVITNVNGFGLDDLKKLVPAAFSKKAAPWVGDRYRHLPTYVVLDQLLEDGWVVTYATQNQPRTEDRDIRKDFTYHMLRLRQRTGNPVIGQVFPEIVLSNAHNARKPMRLNGGLLNMVCTNGLCVPVGGEYHIEKIRHSGTPEAMLVEAYDMVRDLGTYGPRIHAMQKCMMLEHEQANFAHAAAALVWGDENRAKAVPAESILQANRKADEGADLWRVFNRVQENLIRGGIEYETANNRRQVSRPITRVARNIGANVEMWNLAEDFMATRDHHAVAA